MYLKTDSKIIDMQTGTYIELRQDVKKDDYDNKWYWGIFLVIEGVIDRCILIKDFDKRKDAVGYFNRIASALEHSLGKIAYVDD